MKGFLRPSRTDGNPTTRSPGADRDYKKIDPYFESLHRSPLSSQLHTPAAILAIIQPIDAVATLVYNEVDKPLAVEHEARPVLKDLRKGVESLKSGIMALMVLLSAMRVDPGFTFVQVLEGRMDDMKSLERALEATRVLLEEVLAGTRHEATMDPSGSKKPRRALKSVLSVLKANSPPKDLLDLIGDLKDATREIRACQQNNDRAFKLVWYFYVVFQHRTGRASPVYNTGSIDDRVWRALDSVLGAFHVYPFAASPERIHRGNDSHIFAILSHNREAATRHAELARRIGKAWVDDRVREYDGQIQELGGLQTSLFELLWSWTVEQLKQDSPYSSDDPERSEFERTVEELERVLQETILRSKRRHFSIALCGVVEAGKSLFLNALVGRSILPSDELLSTAFPCRLRHVEGQVVPELRFQAEPFLVALKKLQSHQYGRKMQTYHPPPENLFETPVPDAPSEPSEEEILLRTIQSHWSDLRTVTPDNLLTFEAHGFQLCRIVTGDLYVRILLGQLNDIVRLCQRFDIKFDMNEIDWPLITVEFNSLHSHPMDGIYEFIDLPEIDEAFRDFNSESLVRLVASDPNAIIPIVSFKELPHSNQKPLLAHVASGFNGRTNMVVCTHLEQVSPENMDEQLKTVKKAFWPRGVLSTNCVIPCSLIGLSARYLLDGSNTTKPPFEAIWNKHSMGYHCAAKILGLEDPQATYDRFDIQMWQDKLQAELRASGFSGDIQRLAKEMVESARVNALLSDADTVIRQLKEMRIVYERKLLIETTRIEEEYEAAKRDYIEAPGVSHTILETLSRVESMQTREVRLLLEKELKMISQRACGLINQTVMKTFPDCGMSLEHMDVGDGAQSATSGMRGVMQFGGVRLGNSDTGGKLQDFSSAEAWHGNFLVAETRAPAKEFLRLSQRGLSSALETLKREYTAIILDLAGTANAKLLKVVRCMIKQAELQPPPQDWENRIGDLGRPSLNMDELPSLDLRGVINSRQLSIFNRQYCIEIDTLHDRIKGEIIDPWIRKLKEEGENTLFGITETSFKAAKDWMAYALPEREDRCKQVLEKKDMLDGEDKVEHLTAVYSNLLAAEEALGELLIKVKALQTRGDRPIARHAVE